MNYSANTTVERIDLKEGNFATISNEALKNPNLSGDAFRLLIIILNNNAEVWHLSFENYRKDLKWSHDRLAKARKCLAENGYLTLPTTKKYNGCHYTIHEKG